MVDASLVDGIIFELARVSCEETVAHVIDAVDARIIALQDRIASDRERFSAEDLDHDRGHDALWEELHALQAGESFPQEWSVLVDPNMPF